MIRYAEVILPLAVESTFTYAVDTDLHAGLDVGSRVLVQFGRKRYYTAIVASIHDSRPEGYDVKPVMTVLDARPIVRNPQLRLWQWIADYYLCTIGEVYKAAIPAGLKIESETYISLSPDFDIDATPLLSEREAAIVQALSADRRMRIADIEEAANIKRAGATANDLLTRGIVEIDERLVDRYRPKKETFVRLTLDRDDPDSLHDAFNALARSPKGERLLLGYLDRSRWLTRSEELREVAKKELLESVGATDGVLKGLVDKGLMEIYKKEFNRFSASAPTSAKPAELSPQQAVACRAIAESFRTTRVSLLHGVTGSGKTEIYAHLIQSVLDQGDQVLYLVPEISLTTQLTDRLRRIFGSRLLVYHSKFSDSERVDIYQQVLASTGPLVVLGVRSSVFLPFARLGLIVVDEEHESSYKQYDPAPRYNARDTAIVLASMHGAPTLLGSATPSVETFYKASTGKYGYVQLTERYEGAVLPDVEIVDMRAERKKRTVRGILSEPLRSATYTALRDGRQALMFQNRRGFAPMVVCRECGWTPKCTNCDVSLVYHKNIHRLTCHYCGYSSDLPAVCPVCGQNTVETYGYGTERIAEDLHEEFEGFRVARMDLDTTRNKNAYQEIIEEFGCHETDILVGTQMISKGLDFAGVSIVGVLNADTLLNFPDFRSDERAFNMLEQVAGRAGRRQDQKGRVFIQTTSPDSPVLANVKAHNYRAFYDREIAQRARFAYPPFTRVIMVYVKHRDQSAARAAAELFASCLKSVFGSRISGPQPPVVGRIAGFYLQTIMLKVEATASMAKVKTRLREIYLTIAADPNIRSSRIYYDVDPA